MIYIKSILSSVTTFSYLSNWNHEIRLCRSSHRRCSTKKVFLQISQNLQENTCAKVSFLIKLHAWGVFLWILRNFFTEHLRTTPSIFHCTWLLQVIKCCFYWWKTICVIGLNIDMKLAFSLWKDFLETVKLQ